MTIRHTHLNDLTAIMAIDNLSLRTHWHERLYRDEINSEQSLFLVIDVDDEVVGFILYKLIDNSADMLQFAIANTFRRMGLGNTLIEKSMVILQDIGIKTVLLEVEMTNVPAKTIYQKHGFIEAGRRKNYYGLSEDAIVMRKVF